MKKIHCLIITLIFILSIGTISYAETGSLPTIDKVLKNISAVGKTEVSDNMDEYSIFNEHFEDFNDAFKFIILQREAPEKEFTEKKVYPPFSETEGFSSDFTGVDKGPARVWVRADLMNLLPSEFRAKSMDEATYIIMAETLYVLDGTLTVSDFKNTNEEELPEFDNTEELVIYLISHPKEIESVTYYPTFGLYSLITIYEKESRKCIPYDNIFTESDKSFANNLEAFNYWSKMNYISDLMDALDKDKGIDTDYANTLIDTSDFIPETKKDLWKGCLKTEEYSTARFSISEFYWNMAEELKKLDPSVENRKNYDLIIREQNTDALKLFVNFCEYSGFDKPIKSIEAEKNYMATPNNDWTEDSLQELVFALNGN